MSVSKYLSKFIKEKAPKGHAGTILAGQILRDGLRAPFKSAWGYLEGKSMMESHSHPTDEIYTVFRGKGFCHVAEERFPVESGDVIEIPPGAVHTMECEEGQILLWAAFWWDHIEENSLKEKAK